MSDIQDRIAKLLAKARGTDNEHEAEVFLRKAQEMLSEHNLTEDDVVRAGLKDAEQCITRPYSGMKGVDLWRQRVAFAAAKVYFCGMYIDCTLRNGKVMKVITLVGKPHNLDVYESMLDYLLKTVKRLAREYSPDRRVQLDFRRGCGDRLTLRLMALYKEQTEAVQQVSYTGTTLPALYKTELQQVKEAMPSDLQKSRSRGHTYKGDGAAAGRAAADTINLNTQVGANNSRRLS